MKTSFLATLFALLSPVLFCAPNPHPSNQAVKEAESLTAACNSGRWGDALACWDSLHKLTGLSGAYISLYPLAAHAAEISSNPQKGYSILEQVRNLSLRTPSIIDFDYPLKTLTAALERTEYKDEDMRAIRGELLKIVKERASRGNLRGRKR